MANETKIVISAATAQAESALRSLGSSVDGVSRKMFDLSSVAGTLGGALTITAFAGFIKSSIDAADELNNLSQKTGASVEALAGLKFAAEQNDTSLQSVADAAKKLSTSLADKPELFAKLGVTAKDSTGAMVQLADIFAAMPDGAQKSALAVKLFGKAGLDMIPMLNNGTAALLAQIEEGKKYNPVTAENARMAAEFNDRLDKLTFQAGGFGMRLANSVIPNLNDTATAMNELAREGHPVLALWRGLAGMTQVPWDLMIPPENLRQAMSSAGRLKELRGNLKDMRSRVGNEALYNDQEELLRNIKITENMITTIERHAADLDRKPAPEKKTPEQLAAEIKAQRELWGKVNAILDDDKPKLKLKQKRAKTFDPEGDFWFAVEEARIKNSQKAREEWLRDQVKAEEDANRALTQSALEAQAIIFDIDPIAKASAEWEKLLALKEQGLLTDEQIGKSYAKTFGEIDKAGTDAFKSLENAVRGWGNQFTDEMTKMVRTGKMDFASLADSIINDLIRIQIQKNVTDKLVGWGTSFLDGLFGGGSSSTGMSGFSAAQLAGPVMASANGNVFSGAGISAYSGSVVDKPTLFPFARGIGLMGEAGPEAILPLTRVNGRLGVQAQGGAPSVTVNIINAPAGTQVQQRQDGNGGLTLDVIVEQIEGGIARNVQRGQGALNGALTQTFGLNRAAGAY